MNSSPTVGILEISLSACWADSGEGEVKTDRAVLAVMLAAGVVIGADDPTLRDLASLLDNTDSGRKGPLIEAL